MISDIRVLLDAHLPGYAVRSVRELGSGLDNEVYLVNDDLVVRGAKQPDPDATRREVTLLASMRLITPVPVPEVLFSDEQAGVIGYRRLPGEPLHGLHLASGGLGRFAELMGRLLGAMHAVPPADLHNVAEVDTYPLRSWLEDTASDYADVREHLTAGDRRLVEEFLARTPPAEPVVLSFCHNDLGAEHILGDPETGEITGILDWTDAAITDPAHDLALLYRDLGPRVFERVLGAYGRPVDDGFRERAAFYARCALIEDIAYGLSTGPRRYATIALANLARTFS